MEVIYMNHYKLDYTIEKTLNFKPNLEQKFLLEYTGKKFSEEEARGLWLRVIDHKWYISERLNRDIGLRVAAVDYVQNFYKPPVKDKKDGLIEFVKKFFRTIFYSVGPPPVSKNYQS